MSVVKREELYALVWAEPATKVAKRFGISSVALGKAARKAGIPMPPRGYWEKLRYGRKPKRSTLPKMRLGQDALVRFRDKPARIRVELQAIADDIAAEIAAIREGKPLTVRARLSNRHRLLKCRHGVESRTTPLQRRRLRILDALLREFERRGFTVGEERDALWVRIANEQIGISIDEPIRQRREPATDEDRKHSWNFNLKWKHIREPSGELRLRFDAPYLYTKPEWRDKPGQPLESHLPDVLIGLLTAFGKLRALSQSRAESGAREWARRERRLVQETRVKRLTEQAGAFRRVADIRGYLQSAMAALGGVPGKTEWVSWVNAFIEARDPLANGEIEDFVSEFAPGSAESAYHEDGDDADNVADDDVDEEY
jgi:hypothetical protein